MDRTLPTLIWWITTERAAGETMSRMHNPPHPGELVKELCLTPLGLTVTEAAKGLGITRKALSELVNGRSGISPEMALRLEQAFGSTAETWLRMQVEYDLWQTRGRTGDLNVTRFASPAAAAC
jgi:antitoxin HigA-1